MIYCDDMAIVEVLSNGNLLNMSFAEDILDSKQKVERWSKLRPEEDMQLTFILVQTTSGFASRGNQVMMK